jgi:hypothetical protein
MLRSNSLVRYQEVSDDGTPAFAPQVGSLYVRKSAMPGGKIPKVLTVTIKGEYFDRRMLLMIGGISI